MLLLLLSQEWLGGSGKTIKTTPSDHQPEMDDEQLYHFLGIPLYCCLWLIS
jgi:hypothetical protein